MAIQKPNIDKCQKCSSKRIASILSHAADRHIVWIGTVEHVDYLPRDMGIGGGDDNQFTYCLDCGQIQGKWPLEKTELEKQNEQSKSQMGSKIPVPSKVSS